MSQSKTYLKFKETRSQEDLETLNSYLKRLSEISDILNGDEDLDNETENKLYDEDEDLTDKTVRLIFGDVFFVFAEEIEYYLNFLEEPETLYTFTEKTINLFKSFIHEN